MTDNERILEEIRALPDDTRMLAMDGRKLCSLEGVTLPGGLQVLDLRNTQLLSLKGVELPSGLQQLCLSNTRITSLAGVAFPEGLQELDLSFTPLTSLDCDELPRGLETLNLFSASLSEISGSAFPGGMRMLDLSYTNLAKIPSSISRLKNLEKLNLSGLVLWELPDWLPELNLPITGSYGVDGINLYKTHVEGVDMSIFDQSQETIKEWFREYRRNLLEQKAYHLFLGYSHRFTLQKDIKLSDIIAECSKNKRKWYLVPSEESPWDRRPLPEYIKPRFGFEPFDFGKYYYPDRFPDRFKSLPKAEEGLFRWVCGRYVLPGGFANKEWDHKSYPKVYKARTPLYFDAPLEQEDKPLNEVKVVFLGDGGTGKSHTVARLLKDGGQTKDFPNVSTPGIVITDKNYTINGRNIKVHYWDFGGQEILHSMHRMFLTKRTLYVVMVNVRDGNQDERARYWLHNLKSFTDGAPVLLVLNQMDMNKNASVNESDLRKLYPGLTEKIVKLSTLTYGDERFKSEFIDVLTDQIGGMEILDLPLTAAGRRVKEKLQTMTESYIHGDVFRKFCDDSGVKGTDKVRRDLLKQFGQLGVSFCYSDSMELEDHVVLKPDWITNAIYIILFNKVEAVNNGLVSHDTIYRMLTSEDTETIRRTVTDAKYTREEVDYVLKVFRKFRLSFMVEENMEFLPMLCNAKTTAGAAEYENDPDALEFRMHYEYLPNNVIHRLMVDHRKELDRDNVWLTGARFVCGDTGRSAVVKSEGNLIRILVRADKDPRDPQRYLDELKESLERINEIMGLTVSHMEVVYKEDGKSACFDYADLLFMQEIGETHIPCRELRKRVRLADVLMQSDFPADEKQKKLMSDIRQACKMLQEDSLYWKANEDQRTRFLANLLQAKGYIVDVQYPTGISPGGIQSGELDLDIRLTPGDAWSALEALNLKGSRIEYWNAHLKKLLDNYNDVGRSFLFHVSYVQCPKEKFGKIMSDLYEHMRFYSPPGFELLRRFVRPVSLDNEREQNQFLRVVQCVYDCGGVIMTVYQFFVRIGE